MRNLAVIAATGLLTACGTMPYQPTVYPLRDGLIASLPISGTVTVSNSQPSTDQVIVYSYGGSKLASNLNAITAVMVEQAQAELQKSGKPGTGAQKTIALKVDSLLSTYVVFSWKSNIKFQAKLGNGQSLDFTVPHASGVLLQDLNGCIAEGVMVMLNDPRVRTYLAE